MGGYDYGLIITTAAGMMIMIDNVLKICMYVCLVNSHCSPPATPCVAD